jgi:WD40 repeat protein
LEVGYEAYLDRNDIAPGEDWRGRLDQLILQADAVLFVVTDNSLSSEVCSWEVRRTVTLGKRLVPLVNGRLTQQAPAEIAALNYIFSDAPGIGQTSMQAPSMRAIDQVRTALDADIAWVREHARLTARAAEWHSAPEDAKTAKLLRRGDADAARSWMGLRPGPAAPAIPQLLMNFIAASEVHELAERERLRRVIGRGFVTPAVQAVFNERKDHALRLLAAGAVLSDDPDFMLVPELARAAARPVFEKSLYATLHHDSFVNSAVFSPDGRRIATASDDKTACVWDAVSGSKVACLQGHSGTVKSAVFSPDGCRVVTASNDNTACVWDASSGARIACLRGHSDFLRSAVFSPDGSRVVTTSFDRTARIWDAALGVEIACLQDYGACSPDGTLVLTKSDDGVARIWDVGSGAEVVRLQEVFDYIRSSAFSPDGGRVVTCSDHTARVWDVSSGAEIARLPGHERSLQGAAFSPDGARIVTFLRRTAQVWEVASGTEIVRLLGHEETLESAAFSPDGARIVTCALDHNARIWDAASGAEMASLQGHEAGASSATFSPDGARVVTVSQDCTARVWDTAFSMEIARLRVQAVPFSGRERIVLGFCGISTDKAVRIWDLVSGVEIACLSGNEDNVTNAAISPDGARVVIVSDDVNAKVWDVSSCVEVACLQTHNVADIRAAAFSPDGVRIVAITDDKSARVWDSSSGSECARLEGHEGAVTLAAFSPDGARIVTCSDDNTARVWDATSGVEIACLQGHDAPPEAVAFSPDGERIVTTSKDYTARVWDATSGVELVRFEARDWWPNSTAFSPDGRRIVTAYPDQTVLVWDAASGAQLARLEGHGGSVHAAAFSPDGDRIVTAGGEDSTARVWDASTGAELARLQGHVGYVRDAVFSADGMRVITASNDDTVRVWDVASTSAIRFGIGAVIQAALRRGIGRRTRYEASDILMQDAPDDLYTAFSDLNPGRALAAQAAAEVLDVAYHPHRYLSPTQFAKSFRLGLPEEASLSPAIDEAEPNFGNSDAKFAATNERSRVTKYVSPPTADAYAFLSISRPETGLPQTGTKRVDHGTVRRRLRIILAVALSTAMVAVGSAATFALARLGFLRLNG